jgi:hypothetical protein
LAVAVIAWAVRVPLAAIAPEKIVLTSCSMLCAP